VKATEVTAGLAESNGSLLPGLWHDSLHVTCGLTACTPGSAPRPTLGNEYGKTLPFTFYAAVRSLNMSYGPCWEPSWSQVSQALNHIKHPSADPSRPLPFFDKLRLWLHGRLTMAVEHSTWLYHASLDPYNKTEFMDWTWNNFVLDWTNGSRMCSLKFISLC